MTLEQEKKIIKKAQSNSKYFAAIYDYYFPKIFGYVLKRVANVADAQDIVAETFFKTLKSLDSFKWQNVPFSSWLYKIAGNEIINFFRKNSKRTVSLETIMANSHFEPQSDEDIEKEMIVAEEKLQRFKDFLKVQKLLKKLDFKYQEVLSLRYFEKKKIKEVAEILAKKEGTVKSLIFRGLAKLRSGLRLAKNKEKTSKQRNFAKLQPFGSEPVYNIEGKRK